MSSKSIALFDAHRAARNAPTQPPPPPDVEAAELRKRASKMDALARKLKSRATELRTAALAVEGRLHK